MKKLYRSDKDKIAAGVLGGFAEYLNLDSTVVRLGYVLFGLMACFPFILFYLICYIVIPVKDIHHTKHSEDTKKDSDDESIKDEESNVSHETKAENKHTEQGK